MLVRGIERDVLPTCLNYGMGVIPWSPLAGGWLSGQFGAGKENTSRRAARLPSRYDSHCRATRRNSKSSANSRRWLVTLDSR